MNKFQGDLLLSHLYVLILTAYDFENCPVDVIAGDLSLPPSKFVACVSRQVIPSPTTCTQGFAAFPQPRMRGRVCPQAQV
jgi:hypothetical protein